MLIVVQMGVGCLMHLGSEAWELLQGMVDTAPSPRHARRALLMGLQASALKVEKPCPPPMPLLWACCTCSHAPPAQLNITLKSHAQDFATTLL